MKLKKIFILLSVCTVFLFSSCSDFFDFFKGFESCSCYINNDVKTLGLIATEYSQNSYNSYCTAEWTDSSKSQIKFTSNNGYYYTDSSTKLDSDYTVYYTLKAKKPNASSYYDIAECTVRVDIEANGDISAVVTKRYEGKEWGGFYDDTKDVRNAFDLSTSGAHYGNIEQGSSITYTPLITNRSETDIIGLNATFELIDETDKITIVNRYDSLNQVLKGESKTLSFKFDIAPKFNEKEGQYPVRFIIHLYDENNNTWNLPGEFTVHQTYSAIPNQYWGYWIQMDTGNEFYIDSESVIQKATSSYGIDTTVQKGISGYKLESDNIMTKQNGSLNLRFFRKGGSNRSFNVSISGLENTRALSAVKGIRTNVNNNKDKQILDLPSGTNTLTFSNSIAEDEQEITIVPNETLSDIYASSSTYFTPQYDGENMGTIPMVKKNSFAFKTTYTIDSDAQGFCFGNNYKNYSLKINMKNIGEEICLTSQYTISCDDPNFNIVSGNDTKAIFKSINPGDSKNLSFTVNYAKLTSEYVDVPVNIHIQSADEYGNRLDWYDSVTLRFYKGLVNFQIKAKDIENQYNYVSLQGFFIYPDGRSKRFVATKNDSTIQIPWSEKDYYLAFTGADSKTEAGYTFCFPHGSLSLVEPDEYDIDLIYKHENDNTVQDANAQGPVNINECTTGYLTSGDVDFYKINVKELEINNK